MARRKSTAPDMTVEDRLEHLSSLSLDELRIVWREHYPTAAPPRMSPELLQQAIAFKIQEAAFGSFGRRTVMQLNALRSSTSSRKESAVVMRVKPGTKFMREWRGKMHEVLALEDGHFAYDGRRYRSLTMVVQAITGKHSSGPLFFGLSSPRKPADG